MTTERLIGWCRAHRRGLRLMTIGFLLYSVIGFFVVPPVVRAQLLKRLPRLTLRQVQVEAVRFNPWMLSLTVRGLSLTEADGRPFASWGELYVNFQASSIFRWAWTFREISLKRPMGHILLSKDGNFNFANMAAPTANAATPASPPTPGAGVPRLRVFSLSVTNAALSFADETRRTPFRATYGPMHFHMINLATRPSSTNPFSFNLEDDSGLTVRANGGFQFSPIQLNGHVDLANLNLAEHHPYLEDLTPLRLTSGVFGIGFSYHLESGAKGIDATVTNASVRLEQIRLEEPDSNQPVLQWRECLVAGAAAHLSSRRMRIESLQSRGFDVAARVRPDRTLDWSHWLVRPRPETQTNQTTRPSASDQPWELSVGHVRFEEGRIDFADRSLTEAFATVLQPISFELKEWTTRSDRMGEFSFKALTEANEQFALQGRIGMGPIRSSGAVAITSVPLSKYWPYAASRMRGRLREGVIHLGWNYEAQIPDDNWRASVTNAYVRMRGIRFGLETNAEPDLSVAQVAIEGVAADLNGRQVRVERVTVTEGDATLRRGRDRRWNWHELVKAAPASAAPEHGAPTPAPAAPDTSAAWTVSVAKTLLNQCALSWHDQSLKEAAALRMQNVSVAVENLALSNQVSASVRFDAELASGGRVAGSGALSGVPPAGYCEFAVTNLDLRPVAPYLRELTRVSLTSAFVATRGRAEFRLPPGQSPDIRLKAKVELPRWKAVGPEPSDELLGWENLVVDDLEATSEPLRLTIAEIGWDGPSARVVLDDQGKWNWRTVLDAAAHASTNTSAPATVSSESANAARRATPAEWQVDRVRVNRAGLQFHDRSIQPPWQFALEETTARLDGLNSMGEQPARLQLDGRFGDQSTFSILGEGRWSAKDGSLVISNRNLQLSPFTPYLEKFGGHPLLAGRLNSQLVYALSAGELRASNRVQIDQFTLGPRNDSPDSTSLPVKLAVALLKDANGLINLDIPITGRLDDPQFKLSSVILKVMLNLIAKAASSPFSFLGALVGGGDELSFVEFRPGSAEFLPAETNKLQKLAQALAQRPSLQLEIDATTDPKADAAALGRATLRRLAAENRLPGLETLASAPGAMNAPLSDAEYGRRLRLAAQTAYGTNLLRRLQLPATAVSTNSTGTNRSMEPANRPTQPERRGFWRRALVGAGLSRKTRTDSSPLPAAADSSVRAAGGASRPEEVTLEQIEQIILQETAILPEAVNELSQARVQAVRAVLVKQFAVPPDRLILRTPNSTVASPSPPTGPPRATLSLN